MGLYLNCNNMALVLYQLKAVLDACWGFNSPKDSELLKCIYDKPDFDKFNVQYSYMSKFGNLTLHNPLIKAYGPLVVHS